MVLLNSSKTKLKGNFMRFKIYNHNDTFLGEFNTLEEAFKEANFYQCQTGNSYYIDDEEEEYEEE
jgi:hypothetical protein